MLKIWPEIYLIWNEATLAEQATRVALDNFMHGAKGHKVVSEREWKYPYGPWETELILENGVGIIRFDGPDRINMDFGVPARVHIVRVPGIGSKRYLMRID